MNANVQSFNNQGNKHLNLLEIKYRAAKCKPRARNRTKVVGDIMAQKQEAKQTQQED